MKILREEFFVPYGHDAGGAITIRLSGSQARHAVEFRCSLDVIVEGIDYHVRKSFPAYEVGRWKALDYMYVQENVRRDMRHQILREIEKILFPDA